MSQVMSHGPSPTYPQYSGEEAEDPLCQVRIPGSMVSDNDGPELSSQEFQTCGHTCGHT